MTRRHALDRVSMEVGRDAAVIVAEVHASRRIRVRFGTGEEFCGSYVELPTRIGNAAESILLAAKPLAASLSESPDRPLALGKPIRFAIDANDSLVSCDLRLTDLKRGDSNLAPLWQGFSALMASMLVVLFREAPNSTDASPARARAHQLWG